MDIYKNKLDAFLREERNLPVYAEIIGTEAVYTGVVGMHEDEDDWSFVLRKFVISLFC